MSVDFSRKKILIVDDYPEFRFSVKRMLESFGAKDIDHVAYGDEAISNMSKKVYDIILCDYNLGYDKKDGQQVLEEGKHRGLIKYSSIFIMVSAENTMPMVMGALEYQPDYYLVKPITKENLKSQLEKLIKKKNDFDRIEKAIQEGKYQTAIGLCDEQMENDRKNILDYMRLKGDLLIATGNYEEAKKVYEYVLGMRNFPWAKLGLGKVYFFSGNYLDAIDLFQSLIDENKIYMEAYDWLAKTLVEVESMKEAQQVLMAATEISPKSILRQKTIGELAIKNGDYYTAERSLRVAIKLGINSCFKDSSHYTNLAKVLTDQKSMKEALTVLQELRSEFRDNHEASFQAAMGEVAVYKGLNQQGDAKKALQTATWLFQSYAGSLSPDVGVELAKACFDLEEKDTGKRILQDILRNYHSDEKILQKAEEVFRLVKLQEEGEAIINSARAEIIHINNKGVMLLEEGKLEEAIDHFEKAADGLPENKIINANAAKAVLVYIQQYGKDARSLARAGKFMDRIGSADKNYQKIWEMYEEIVMS